MPHRSSSAEQRSLAAFLGIDVSTDTRAVAAARLLDKVAGMIGFEPSEPASERQKAFAESLGENVGTDTKRVASAKISESLFTKNQEAISALNLRPGDRVVRVEHFEFDGDMRVLEREFVVSSIQPNGRVFFKGGNGQGAWPTQLRRSAS
jgi:hypothetical protein